MTVSDLNKYNCDAENLQYKTVKLTVQPLLEVCRSKARSRSHLYIKTSLSVLDDGFKATVGNFYRNNFLLKLSTYSQC